MNRIFLIIFLITLPILSAGGKANVISLTADDVVGAEDIEYAINIATGYGSHPGTVILDSKDGDFSFTTSDKSINIFVPNLTLMSKNRARITNCDGAISFDALPINNVTIQGIDFVCSGDGITASDYPIENLKIIDNLISVPGQGLSFSLISNSEISKNTIISEWWGVHLLDNSSNIKILNNKITSSSIGIFFQDVNSNQAINNQISANEKGILLGYGSDGNQINANKIQDVQNSGIALEGNNFDNKIHGNKVDCANSVECLVIDATLEIYANNKISGNQ